MAGIDREAVADRAERCCEYCFSQELISHDDFAVEHIRPVVRGGTDVFDNLAWSCQGCNSRKYTAQHATDPVNGQSAPLYNPRRDRWRDHFVWGYDFARIEGISPTGRATVARLDLNWERLVSLRRVLREANYHPPLLTVFAANPQTPDT